LSVSTKASSLLLSVLAVGKNTCTRVALTF
jgi:hypothetical protein